MTELPRPSGSNSSPISGALKVGTSLALLAGAAYAGISASEKKAQESLDSEPTPITQTAGSIDIFTQQIREISQKEGDIVLENPIHFQVDPSQLGVYISESVNYPQAIKEGGILTDMGIGKLLISYSGEPFSNNMVTLIMDNSSRNEGEPYLVGQHLNRMYHHVMQNDMEVTVQQYLYYFGDNNQERKNVTLKQGEHIVFIPVVNGMPGISTAYPVLQNADGSVAIDGNGDLITGGSQTILDTQKNDITQVSQGGTSIVIGRLGPSQIDGGEAIQTVEIIGVQYIDAQYQKSIYEMPTNLYEDLKPRPRTINTADQSNNGN